MPAHQPACHLIGRPVIRRLPAGPPPAGPADCPPSGQLPAARPTHVCLPRVHQLSVACVSLLLSLSSSAALSVFISVHDHHYVHGHIQHRNFFEHEGIHILNTPATSYVADKKTSTTGWTMARLSPTGGTFTTYTHLPEHEWNGAAVDLKWRV